MLTLLVFAHRDLKVENMLLDSNSDLRIIGGSQMPGSYTACVCDM